MIDHMDKQTQSLPLEQKRGRGRPATGQALSNAERQRLYRERHKAQRKERPGNTEQSKEAEEVQMLQAELRRQVKANERLRDDMKRMLRDHKQQITYLKTELAQRNEKPSRLNEGMQKIIQDVHEVADAIEGSTWRIQRKTRTNGKWVTLKGSYWNEAQAEDALADMPNKKGAWWRIVEVKSKVED